MAARRRLASRACVALAQAMCWLALTALNLPAVAQPAISSAESSAPAPEAALEGARLVDALRRGGLVVYFRHTATDFSRDDRQMTGYSDCERQRPPTDQGQRDAQEIGQRIRALGLPVGEALASPMCRTMEHARLMLGEVTGDDAVRESAGGDFAGLKRLLALAPAAGNRWIVGHGIPFRAVAGPPHLAEGEAAVVRPETNGWTVVARLQVGDWQTLPLVQ